MTAQDLHLESFGPLPSADAPAEVQLQAVEFFDHSQFYNQELDPHARVNVILGGRRLETFNLYAGQLIEDAWQPANGLQVTQAEIARAQDAADKEIEEAHSMTHCMLVPILGANWSDVPERAPFRTPAPNYCNALYIWDDATQSGSAHAQEVIAFARDPRNNLACYFYDSKAQDWKADESPIEYAIAIEDNTGSPYLSKFQFVTVTATRAGQKIAQTTFMPGSFEDPLEESGITGIPGATDARAIARSLMRAHLAGKATARSCACITVPAPNESRPVH